MNFEALPADEFLEEAQELLQEIEESLLLLEEDPVDQNVIQRLFRSAHTLNCLLYTSPSPRDLP